MKELRTVIDYERWYNDSYQSFHVRKPCVVVCKKEVPRYVSKRKPEYAQEEYLAELEYARCYDKMWYEHEARVNARKRYEMILGERKAVLKCGYDAARAKLEARGASSASVYRGRSCIAKCKGCQKWVFDDNPDDVCKVESSSMTPVHWKALFANEPKRYRKEYMRNDDEHSFIYVHEECAIECPGCLDMCLLQHISQFGACYPCCKYFKEQMSKLEKSM
jgi:hypothetical protein